MSADRLAAAVLALLRERLAKAPGLLVLGLCGAQGSGKTTLAQALTLELTASGVPTAQLSLDDLYATRAEREAMAREVHPLFRTRGVPGTHDVALGLAVIDALARGEAAALPRFDKAHDDRVAESDWPLAPAGCRVLVFEGWCVGARPQAEGALAAPVNRLEAEEDPHGLWRRHANARLVGEYQQLFARLDRLVMLAAPSFAVVRGWRLQQERELAARSGEGSAVMDAAGIDRFIQFYQRLTEHMLAEMPARADLVARLGEQRELLDLRRS